MSGQKTMAPRVKTPVLPRDCALLFGIPLTRSCLQQKLDGPSSGYFGESFRARTVDLTWTGYAPFAEQFSALASYAESLGVRVFRQMRLEDITCAASSAAVTIVSHWRTARFQPGDIVDSAGAIRSFPECILGEGGAGVDLIADGLNRTFPSPFREAEHDLGAHIQYQRALETHRQSFVVKSPQAFRGGAGVEFADGFKSVGEITAHFPACFSGVVDLTVCSSLLLAESLRSRFPHSLTLGASDLVYPYTRLPIYRALLGLLETGRFTYEDAMNYIQKRLKKEF